jgi:segregation and condensation protein A
MPRIQLPVFEGPLDLLLHLIERDDLDITAVSLVAVADQYLRAVRGGEGFEPGALAEFVSIGAKLIYLKSKALLPRAPEDPLQLLEDDEVGRELVDLLREYRRFTQVVDMLETRQRQGFRTYGRLAPTPAPPPDSGLKSVTVDRLCALMAEILSRKPAEPRGVIVRETTVTLSGRVTELRSILRSRGKFSFRRAIEGCRTRIEVVISFMAILELLKAGDCDAVQANAWGDIEVIALAPAA